MCAMYSKSRYLIFDVLNDGGDDDDDDDGDDSDDDSDDGDDDDDNNNDICDNPMLHQKGFCFHFSFR